MGGDCCGGGADTQAAQEQLQELYVTAPVQDGKTAPGPAAAAPVADAERVKEKMEYYKRRIELFENYKQRQVQAKSIAEAANKSLKGARPRSIPRHEELTVCNDSQLSCLHCTITTSSGAACRLPSLRQAQAS